MHSHHPLRAVTLMMSAMLCFALLDATSKHLSQTFNVPLLVWARYTVQTPLAAGTWYRRVRAGV